MSHTSILSLVDEHTYHNGFPSQHPHIHTASQQPQTLHDTHIALHPKRNLESIGIGLGLPFGKLTPKRRNQLDICNLQMATMSSHSNKLNIYFHSTPFPQDKHSSPYYHSKFAHLHKARKACKIHG